MSSSARGFATRTRGWRAVARFLAWVEADGVDLARVTPGMAGRFLDTLSGGPAAKQQALSGCRQYCAGLVQRHAMILNPFASVTGERYQVIEGRTPEITISQARALLASLETSRPLGLRDRALFGTLCYTGARIGATLALQRGDLVDAMLRLREKGGKQRILPVRADTFGHGSSRRGRRVPARGHASQCPGLRHDTTRHAAEQGHADAQAASWYRKSAARGAAAAPVDLGISYNAGVGVPPNYGDAVAWYRRSADQGLASAQVDLGARDDRGEGRPTGVR